jgi:hemolysin III
VGDAALQVKPLLRGWSHALAAVVSVVGMVILLSRSTGDAVKLTAFAVYGVTLVLLFGFSAAYHIPHWSPRNRRILRGIDHANIFLLIAGTYTPVTAVLLRGGLRVGLLIAIWSVAAVGIALASGIVAGHRRALAAIYVLTGWIGIIATPQIVSAAGGAVALIVVGGVIYSLGAVVYAIRRPRGFPTVFGYHEVFHVAVIAASACFYAFMVAVVAPAATG